MFPEAQIEQRVQGIHLWNWEKDGDHFFVSREAQPMWSHGQKVDFLSLDVAFQFTDICKLFPMHVSILSEQALV